MTPPAGSLQVRDNALSALQALNQTLSVLGDVSRALEAAQSTHHMGQDPEAVKAVAARAMQVSGTRKGWQGCGC